MLSKVPGKQDPNNPNFAVVFTFKEGKDQERSNTCLELTHQPSPLLSCVYQRGLVTQAPCLPQKIGIYAAKLPEN